jgi:AcrR family transcriptional regulator
MARTRDPAITDALLAAARELVAERGFGAVSLDAVAERAGVGKPAIYRRFRDKADLVAAVLRAELPRMEPPPPGPARERLRALVDRALPGEAETYAGLLGGLMAEHRRHPELMEAYRSVLMPRRAIVRAVVEEGIARGEIRPDVDPEWVVDAIGGAFLVRVFAGLDVGPAWRARGFAALWEAISV